ncbi:MAG: PQQ-binding-like beta-propeller repeat protein, partial [Armatimonadota bacterium]
MKWMLAWLAMAWVCLGLHGAQAQDVAASATEILDATGIKGGLVAHLGCGDGKLTAALHANECYVVHGLDADARNVARAREHIQSLGLYGDVSVEQWRNTYLPYADNLVNLVVWEKPGRVRMNEVRRVLAPNGVAYIKAGRKWSKTVKPRPEDIDEWSHFLHDAGNNAVASDAVVGPPRTLQWIAGPLWLRSHETPSGHQAQVAAGGRLFYILDEGLIGITDERLPDRWSLVCRDAFNGMPLWKRSIDPWGWREWARGRWEGQDWTRLRSGRTNVPNENQRRVVADGDRLYATIGFRGPVSILDAATGEAIATVEGTEGAVEILASDGIVLAYVKDLPSDAERRRGEGVERPSVLVAAKGETGEVLWKQEARGIRPLQLAIDDGRVIYQTGQELVSLGLRDGEELWRVEPAQKNGATLVASDGVVLIKAGAMVEAHDAASGEFLWSKKTYRDNGSAGVDLFVANGLVWPGMLAVDEGLKPGRANARAMAIGLDPRTGEEKRRVVASDLRSFEHHHRCYRNKATDRYMIASMEGAEFMDLQSDNHSQNNWVRGSCRLGMMPCNGMLYVPPDQCFCHPGSKLLGYAALGPESATQQRDVPDGRRLSKGPAFGSIRGARFGSADGESTDWPTYRHDAARSGSVDSAVSTPVAPAWRERLGGRLTAPVAANGKVLVAAQDAHTVHALDATTGARLWKYTAGGRIDSPPTIYKGLVLFGSRDGRVYCLRETDGALVWRFLAAPRDRRVGYFGQVESAWPVHGSVLVEHGVAYFAAGLSTYLDGGIRLYGLDPATGKILHKGLLEGPHPAGAGQRDYSFYTLGANSDVLVAEGGYIYMRQKKLTPALDEVKPEVLSSKGEMDVGLHVFSTAGLLDGSWYNRTFWMYSKRWPGFQLANQAPKTGQLLVVDDEAT